MKRLAKCPECKKSPHIEKRINQFLVSFYILHGKRGCRFCYDPTLYFTEAEASKEWNRKIKSYKKVKE